MGWHRPQINIGSGAVEVSRARHRTRESFSVLIRSILRTPAVSWRLLSLNFVTVELRECWYSLGLTATSHERAV